MNDVELQAAADRLMWFHSMTLRPGVVTRGLKDAAMLAAETSAILEPLDLVGRSLLDIGAWNGYWSFEAKRRGAAHVTALDSFTWAHPGFRGFEAFCLARDALGLDVDAVHADITEAGVPAGSFDVVLFLGVFYHLEDPFPVLAKLRRSTRLALVVETHQDLLDLAGPAAAFYPGRELADDPTNWWGPNPALMFQLLRRAGFGRIFYQDHPVLGRTRGIFQAFLNQDPGPVLARPPAGWLDLDAPGSLATLVQR